MIRAALLLALTAARAAGLEAAAGKVDITPAAGEAAWLAGYGARGRRAAGVLDPLHARLLLLREGRETVALAAFDLIGLSREQVLSLRRAAGFDSPGRSLLVHATHTHAGPDTLGLWGPLPGRSGVDARYLARVESAVAAELKALEGRLRPVRAAAASGALDPAGLCRDRRPPAVLDRSVSAWRLEASGRPVATVVGWSCHPDVLDRDNRLFSADFPGALCRRVEERSGGTCLFLNGAIGGMLLPDVRGRTAAEAARVGRTVADAALALRPRPAPTRPLAYRAERILLPVENSRYLLLLPALAGGHRLLDARGRPLPRRAAWTLALKHLILGLRPQERPWVESEVSLLDAGPARLLGLPGEPFPELVLPLRARLGAPAPMVVGLANDQVGYLVPAGDFRVRDTKTLLPRLPGHYEETNSLGKEAAGVVLAAAERLLEEGP